MNNSFSVISLKKSVVARKRSALCSGTAVFALAIGICVSVSINPARAATVSEIADVGDVDLVITDSIYTDNGTAVTGIAVAGTVEIDTTGQAPVGSVTGSGIFGAALSGGDVTIDSGAVSAGAEGVALPAPSGDILLLAPFDIYKVGGGVVAYSYEGTATVNTHGNISVNGGTFGAVAISDKGEANVNLNGITIDPPLIGAAAIVLNGFSDANITTGAATIDAVDIGLLGLHGGSGNVNINAEGATIGAIDEPAYGIVGYALYGGDVNIDAANSTVNAATGIVGYSPTGGKVEIDSGVVNASGLGSSSFGVVGVGGQSNGDVVIVTHGNTTANGQAAVLGLADGGAVEIDLLGNTVSAKNGTGVQAVAGYDVTIKGQGSTVSGQQGVVGISKGYDDHETQIEGGDVSIDTGVVTATGGIGPNTGVYGQAYYGNVRIATHGNTTSDGKGVVGYASGNVNIDLLGNTVKAASGEGVVASAGGNVNVQAAGSTIIAKGTGISAIGKNVVVDSGAVTSAEDSGVVAIAVGGDATIVTHGKIVADNGEYGAVASSDGGNASVTVNGVIDPPAIGASAQTLGSGTATVINNSSVEATAIGLHAVNSGSGNVVITNNGTVGAGPTDPAPLIGISAANTGPGATTITNAKGAQVYALGSAISAESSDPGVGSNNIAIYNDGRLQGNGVAQSTIFSTSDGSLSLINDVNGLITTSQAVPTDGNIIKALAEGTVSVTNKGVANGTFQIIAFGADSNGLSVDLNNSAAGKWNFSGDNAVIGGSDIRVTNAGTISAKTASLSKFATDTGDIVFANSGTLETNGSHSFAFVHPNGSSVLNNTGNVNVNGSLALTGLDNFNNSKLVNTKDGDTLDRVRTSGNFNAVGAGGTFAFDAQLKAKGVADILTVDGNVTGVTKVVVNDTATSVPGQLVTGNDAIVFAYVGGATSAATPNFTTNGGIDKGLFRFDAYLRNTPVNNLGYDEWVLASTPDREAFEVPVVEYAAQNLWQVSTGTWLDRTADLRSTFTGGSDGAAGNVTPAAWVRVFGGNTEREFANSVETPTGLSGSGPYSYAGKFKQNVRGFMAGLDLGPESLSSSGENQAWLFGLLGGYTESSVKFATSGTKVDLNQASVGGYITRLDGPLFVDLVVKADFGKIDYRVNDGVVAGNSKSNYTSVGAIIDTGYRLPVGGSVFVEPKATLSYVHTDFDQATLLGTGVEFDDGESLRGRLGLRLGASLPSGNGLIEPYIEGSAWHEFKGAYGVNLSSGGNDLPIGYDVEGTFGEAALGVSYANRDSGLSLFARGTMQFGDDKYRSYVGNVGLRYQWGGHSAPVAVAPAPAAPTPPPPPPVVRAPAPAPQMACNKGVYLVFFDWDKSDITSEAATILNSAVTAYGSCAAVPVMLAGYTDRSGSDTYNVGLAARRNSAVRGYLASRGIPDSEMSSRAFGESSPRVPTADGVRELQNRRVEITYGPGSGN